MKKRWVSILLCLTMASMLLGCGSDASGNPVTSASSEAQTESDSSVSGTLTIWEHNTSFETSLDSVVSGFTAKYPNIDVEYEFKEQDQYYNLLNIAIQSGDAPDIFWTNGTATNNLSELVKAGAVLGLSDFLDTSNIPDNCMQISTIDGEVYSVPWSCIDTRACFYNKDIFEKNGWEIPKTYDEFVALLQAQKDAGYIPISLDPNFCWDLLFAYEPVLSAYDSEYTEGLADYSVKATDQPARDAMNEMLSWADKGYFGDNYLGVADEAAMVLTFTSGEAAMCLAGSWEANTFMDNNPNLNLGAFQIPDKNGKRGMVGTNANGFSVYSNSPNLEAAKLFIQYCASIEAQQAWVEGQGAVSGNPNVKSGSAIAEEIADADTIYTSWQSVLTNYVKEGENASTLFENDMTKVFSKEITTDEFFDEIEAVMQ